MQALFTFLLGIGTTVLRGYILSLMWGWFILSHFPGMPQIGVLECIGLSFLVGLFTMHSLTFTDYLNIDDSSVESRRKYSLYNAFAILIATLSTWLGAWVVHLFM